MQDPQEQPQGTPPEPQDYCDLIDFLCELRAERREAEAQE